MEIVTIRVYYDFASTLCYVAHRVIAEVQPRIDESGLQLEWTPIDLTMAAPWDRGDSFTDEVRESVRNTGLSLGIDCEMPDPWLDSRPASHAALCMPDSVAEARWRDAVFESIHTDKQPVLTKELRDLAVELAGTDALVDSRYGFPLVERSTQVALELGLTGVPMFLTDNGVFGGVYDGDSMVSMLDQLGERFREKGISAIN